MHPNPSVVKDLEDMDVKMSMTMSRGNSLEMYLDRIHPE